MKKIATGLLLAALAGCANLPPELNEVLQGAAGATGRPGALSESDIAAGLKEALAVGTQRTVAKVGTMDGFWRDAAIRIALPDQVKKAEKTLRTLGQGALVDEFHMSLNRAAEKAAPEAASIFGDAIRSMTLADARGILNGPNNAATEYVRGKTSATLTARFKPIVAQSTASVGATRKYKDLNAKVTQYLPGYQMQDLDAYVTDRALAGLFTTLAGEELKIRQDPAARTTELLKRVFGSR